MFCSFQSAANTEVLRHRRSLPIVDGTHTRLDGGLWDHSLRRDLKTLARFLDIYCRCRHAWEARETVCVSGLDVDALAGKKVALCPDCAKLLTHAIVKRSHCPMDPKPACKRCPSHCYHPAYRKKIQEVMRFSGKRLFITGRLDYIFHMLF